jgi:hypothetical protein
MVAVQCNMSSRGQPELACSEPMVVMMLQVFGNHSPGASPVLKQGSEAWKV